MSDATSADLDNEENDSSMMAAMMSAGLESMIDKDDSTDDISSNEEISVQKSEELIVNEEEDFDVDAIVAEGEVASRSGDHVVALEAFNRAIALDPSCAMAWFNRGVLLEGKQDPRGAKQSFTICLDLNPDHGPALANLAILLERVGDEAGAYSIGKRALQHFPGHPTILSLITRCESAKETEVEIAPVMPDHQTSWQEKDLSTAMETAGVIDRQAVLQEATHHDSDGNAILDAEELARAASMVKARKDAEVIAEARQDEIIERPAEVVSGSIPEVPVPTLEPPVVELDIDAICDDAEKELLAGEAKTALASLKPHLHGAAANHARAWKIAAGSMARLGLDDHAINAFTHSLNLVEDAKAWFNLGALHLRKGNTTAAQSALSSSLNKDGNYLKAAQKLAEVAKSNADVAVYLDTLRALVRIGNDEQSKRVLANELISLAEGEADILENSHGLPPTIPLGPDLAAEAIPLLGDEISPLKARAMSAFGDHTNAVITWKAIIQQDKESADSWSGLAKALENAGDVTTAQRCHEKANNLRNGSPVVPAPPAVETNAANLALSQPVAPQPIAEVQQNTTVNLAAAALDASSAVSMNQPMRSDSSAIANQDVDWYNKGVALIEDKKCREALGCFDKALSSFAGNDQMVIRILNGRGNAYYYLADYPKCVESYHQAMVIDPTAVRGQTLYNMGTAYAEMQRYEDGIKCFEQAMPRGLSKEESKLAKEQIRRCRILLKEQLKKSR